MNETIAKLNEAKTNKWLDVKVRDAVHGIITRRELLSKELVGKRVTTERYEKRKINLEYKELKTPKVEYWLDMFWRGENYSMKCPKYVWESTVAVVKG